MIVQFDVKFHRHLSKLLSLSAMAHKAGKGSANPVNNPGNNWEYERESMCHLSSITSTFSVGYRAYRNETIESGSQLVVSVVQSAMWRMDVG